MNKIRYAEKLQKGSIILEKKDNAFILSNLDTGINARFSPREYTRAIENFQMWTRVSHKRFADW
jgi:hypothetical protein